MACGLGSSGSARPQELPTPRGVAPTAATAAPEDQKWIAPLVGLCDEAVEDGIIPIDWC